MEGLSLINFKSYSKHNIFGFNPYINVIIGGNGQGKSNIFKAFSFVLSDRLQINRSQFSAHLHHGIDVSNQRSVEAEIVMRDKEGSKQFVKISKVWKHNLTEQCYVNSKLTNKRQYENFVQSLCLSYTNPYNIVQQGKINQITLMDEFELYKLLQEITGVKKFNKRKEQALSIMKKIQLQKQQTKTALLQLDQKLKSLENKKQEFDFFSIQEKTKKFRTKKYLTQLLEGTKHNIQKMKIQYDEVSESLSKIILKKKMIEQNIDEGMMTIRIEKQKLLLIDKSTNIETQIPDTQDFKDIQRKQKQVNKQLKQLAKKMRQKDRAVQIFKKDFIEVEQNYENLKLSKQLNKPKQGKEKAISAFQNQIKSDQLNLKQLQQQKQKATQKVDQIQKNLSNKKNTQIQSKYFKIQEQVKTYKQNLAENKRLNSQLAWQRNVISLQAQSLKQLVHNSQNRMKKMLPNLDFTLLDYIRQSKIEGVYGYFIEFVKIDPNVAFAYEIVGMNKLCSLLVQDEEACIAVIQANRKIKGRQINIIQLDYIRGRPADSQSAPKSDSVRKLSNVKWIKPFSQYCQNYSKNLQKDIQKLIKNTFQKYALVKDYQTGLKVSKQYHLNCITGDRQIVYSQGYHCKLGQQSIHHESSLQIFYKFQEKRQQYYQKQKQKQQLDAKILQTQNQQINIINKQQKLQIQMNKMSHQFNQLKTQRKMLQVYKKNLEQLNKNIKDNQQNLSKKRQTLKMLTSNTKSKQNMKFSKAQSQKIQSLFSLKRKQLNKMLTQIYQIEQIMQKLTIEKQQLDNQVINAKNSKAAGVINPNSIVFDIQKNLSIKQKEIKQLQKQAQQLNKIQSQISANKSHVQVKLITYRAEEEDIETKLAQVGQIQQDIQQLQQLSNSMSVSMMHGRKKNRHFSAKDKLLFTKFGNILQSFSSHKKTFKQLEEAQQKIKRTINQYQLESEQYMSQIAKKFEKQFIDIFGFIVNQGQAQVRFKKVSQKIKDVIRYKNCLTIKVSFSRSAQAMKKWNDFSGGEKTVIALTMVLALQRCQPAPFYVLDEVDAALDSVFVQRIAELLAIQSQRNKSQYFISSFKQDMLSFPEQICNYYLVTAQNRQSQIKKIKQSKALDALRSLVVKK